MTLGARLARSTAVAFVRGAAAWLEPTPRREWGRAMRAELDYIDNDYAALRFAWGCVLAGITLGSRAMDIGNLRVSRLVLTLEMALCFVPLTMGWFAVMFDPSGVAWLDAATVERYYLGTTEGVAALTKMFVGAVIGLLGPLGLVVALRHIVLGRALRRGWLRAVLVGGPILLAAVYVVANLATGTEFTISWGGFYVLFAVLPLAGAVHLIYLGDSSPDAHSRAGTA